ncbi:MAG: hypothetical protein HYW91_00290 [Candidatus Sungbacteria bacterium]|nr:hypothetical protein [Candidatus Sungbacteria bacterium]
MPQDSQKEKGAASAEEEILELERKLEEKKRELAESGAAPVEEKEVFREVLREHVEEARPQAPGEGPAVLAPSVTHVLADDLKKKADEVKKKELREEQVRELIEFALTRTINDAVKVAERATPWLLDELHDHLVDDYYEKLVQLRKLKQL